MSPVHPTRVRIFKPAFRGPGFVCEVDGQPIRNVRTFSIDSREPVSVPVVKIEILAIGGVDVELVEALVKATGVNPFEGAPPGTEIEITTEDSRYREFAIAGKQ